MSRPRGPGLRERSKIARVMPTRAGTRQARARKLARSDGLAGPVSSCGPVILRRDDVTMEIAASSSKTAGFLRPDREGCNMTGVSVALGGSPDVSVYEHERPRVPVQLSASGNLCAWSHSCPRNEIRFDDGPAAQTPLPRYGALRVTPGRSTPPRRRLCAAAGI